MGSKHTKNAFLVCLEPMERVWWLKDVVLPRWGELSTLPKSLSRILGAISRRGSGKTGKDRKEMYMLRTFHHMFHCICMYV